MLITRCPSCNTAFRVSPEQLKAMQGRVRCGHCQFVFNAIDSLADMDKESADESVETQDLFSPQEPVPPIVLEAQEEIDDAELPSVPINAAAEDRDAAVTQIEPLLHLELDTIQKRRTWPWALAAALALILLLLQVIIQFRVELSVLAPEAKPVLQDLCALFGCDIPLPRKVDLLSIESSDLHPDDGGQLLLVATLKNRAPFAQTYPDLELTLTDITDQPLLRKILTPADYLPGKLDAASGFVANGEIAVNLALTHADSTVASGYRLYLFYP